MSTRCQLGVYVDDKRPLKEWYVLLYRHFDGYPSSGGNGVLPDITEFLRDFMGKRDDPEYCGAQLITHMINTSNQRMVKSSAKGGYEWKNDFTGYGICKEIHGDIQYFYRITPTRIVVYEVTDPDKMDAWKKIKTVMLQRKNKQKEDTNGF